VPTDGAHFAGSDGASCDVFLCFLPKGASEPLIWSRAMADQPIIFAMANPDPEMTPEEVAEIPQTMRIVGD